MNRLAKYARPVSLFTILALYALYLAFIITNDRGPVDYETFMSTGQRFLAGQPVYTENSYYPLPTVMIFSALSALPRPISMALWLGAPLIAILLITRADPLMLLFAPALSHFLGGQSSLPALLGVWGYRRAQQSKRMSGGVWLAVALLKPHLAVIPVLWAVIQWIKEARQAKKLPGQAAAFLFTALLIYLPSFIIRPGWLIEWLSVARPLKPRAMAGFIPRSLLIAIDQNSLLFWILVVLAGGISLYLVWRFNQKRLNFDTLLLWSFAASPLVHDYDLIQLIPLLDSDKLRRVAVLLSIPGWLVILSAYGIDQAWFVFSLIPPGLLWLYLSNQRAPTTSSPLPPS